jgi:hypothetical protein
MGKEFSGKAPTPPYYMSLDYYALKTTCHKLRGRHLAGSPLRILISLMQKGLLIYLPFNLCGF